MGVVQAWVGQKLVIYLTFYEFVLLIITMYTLGDSH
jgi:hypothetical protein